MSEEGAPTVRFDHEYKRAKRSRLPGAPAPAHCNYCHHTDHVTRECPGYQKKLAAMRKGTRRLGGTGAGPTATNAKANLKSQLSKNGRRRRGVSKALAAKMDGHVTSQARALAAEKVGEELADARAKLRDAQAEVNVLERLVARLGGA